MVWFFGFSCHAVEDLKDVYVRACVKHACINVFGRLRASEDGRVADRCRGTSYQPLLFTSNSPASRMLSAFSQCIPYAYTT